MNPDPSPGPAGSAAGLAARVALALERHHDLGAGDIESAGKRIDRLLERIDFGLLGIERVKRELGLRRAELLSRHADELRALDAQQTEIETLEQTIDAFARKFNIAGAEVVVPFEGERNPRGQARG